MRSIMPAAAPPTEQAAGAGLKALGARLRSQRKRLGVSAVTAAQAAGMSRVTLHRVERGEPSVTMGAYLNAAAALGLELGVVERPPTRPAPSGKQTGETSRVALADYPQLRRLAWQFQGVSEVTAAEALDLYERNWRHIDQSALTPLEQALIQRLLAQTGRGRLLV
jgi:transcriptional regulator with XRE-family HTH domain